MGYSIQYCSRMGLPTIRFYIYALVACGSFCLLLLLAPFVLHHPSAIGLVFSLFETNKTYGGGDQEWW